MLVVFHGHLPLSLDVNEPFKPHLFFRIASMTYRVRVKCDENYFNTTCTKFCRPRNDVFGHYTCDTTGDKVCMEGWMGHNCDTGRLVNQVLRNKQICLADIKWKTLPTAFLRMRKVKFSLCLSVHWGGGAHREAYMGGAAPCTGGLGPCIVWMP